MESFVRNLIIYNLILLSLYYFRLSSRSLVNLDLPLALLLYLFTQQRCSLQKSEVRLWDLPQHVLGLEEYWLHKYVLFSMKCSITFTFNTLVDLLTIIIFCLISGGQFSCLLDYFTILPNGCILPSWRDYDFD